MDENENKQVPGATPPPPREIDDSEFVVRAKSIIDIIRESQKNSSVFGERLRYAFTEDPDAFNEQLDELVDSIADRDPEYQDILRRMKEAQRTSGDNPPQLIAQIKELRKRFREAATSELGLPDEARFSAIEAARQRISDLIETNPTNPKTPREILVALGIRNPGEEGRPETDTYAFPYELMPPDVIAKWETYLATVAKHVLAERTTPMDNPDRQYIIKSADETRKFAHDSLTTDFHAVLGLQGNEGWDFKSSRHLLGLIRNFEFSNNDNELVAKARHLVSTHTSPLNLVTALSHGLDHEH